MELDKICQLTDSSEQQLGLEWSGSVRAGCSGRRHLPAGECRSRQPVPRQLSEASVSSGGQYGYDERNQRRLSKSALPKRIVPYAS